MNTLPAVVNVSLADPVQSPPSLLLLVSAVSRTSLFLLSGPLYVSLSFSFSFRSLGSCLFNISILHPSNISAFGAKKSPRIRAFSSLALQSGCRLPSDKVDLSRYSSIPGLGEGCCVGMLRFGRMKKKTKAEPMQEKSQQEAVLDHHADPVLSSPPDLTLSAPPASPTLGRPPSVSLPHVDTQLSMHQYNDLFDPGLAEEDEKHQEEHQRQGQQHQNGSSTAVATDCSTLGTG